MSPHPTPARSRNQAEALEVQIEEMWLRLNSLGKGMTRTVRLSAKTGRLVMAYPCEEADDGEIGTYSRGVELAQFREDVFHVWGGKR